MDFGFGGPVVTEALHCAAGEVGWSGGARVEEGQA